MKSFKQFINESKSDIDSICKKYRITNYTINSDGSIDVDDGVDLSSKSLTNIPLKFRNVTGYFCCEDNKLTSLQGCPISVGGDFYCSDNQLVSLKGSPQSVDGDFYCRHNQLTTLQGCPIKVDGNFNCYNNQLTSLQGCPEIGGDFHCRHNQIKDFKGISEFFEGDFYCADNPIWEIFFLFNTGKWINEYDVIDGNKVIMDRLEEVYHQLGIDIPENIVLDKYEII